MPPVRIVSRPCYEKRVPYGTLRRLVQAIPRLNVAVIGDLIADVHVFGRPGRLSREAPIMVVQETHRSVLPGGAGNVALNLRSLGARVSLLGVVGRDGAGLELVSQLKDQGVDTHHLIQLTGRNTPCKTRIWAGDVHTIQQQILRVDRDAFTPVPSRITGELATALDSNAFDAVIVVDYGYGLLSKRLLRQLAALAAHRPVVADSRYRIQEFKDLTAVKPNQGEAEAASGVEIDRESTLHRAGQALLRRTRAQAVLLTRGNKGMSLFLQSGVVHHIAAWGSRDIVDVSGAGDTVGALFAAALGLKASPLEAAHLANIGASVVVMKKGAASPLPAELLLLISDEHCKDQIVS